MHRQRVAVVTLVDVNGYDTPQRIVWRDGREYPVVNVMNRKSVTDKVTGERGTRFGVTIERPHGFITRWLYKFRGIWYVYPHDRSDFAYMP